MKLLLVCEGDGDDDDLKVITLKVLHEAHPWMVGLESLEAPTPEWFEYERGRGFLRWGDVDKACDAIATKFGAAAIRRAASRPDR